MKKHFTAHVIFAATAMASQQAWALGFGRAVSDAVLGQSFSFTVPVNVEPGEHFAFDCMSTQVYYGENLLPPNAVRTELDRGATDNTWTVRIIASTPVEEPIIAVSISAGCERRFTRRFSVFADPPTLAPTAAQMSQGAVAALSPRAAASTADNAGTAGATPPAGRVQRHTTGAPSPMGIPRPRVVRKGPTMALANELNAPPAAAPSARHVIDAGSARKPGPRVSTPAPSPVDSARLLLDAGVPHLKLDMEEPLMPPAAAASGTSAALSDLDDLDTRALKALEASIQAAKRDTQAEREQTARLQAELAAAQSRSDWAPWLIGMLAVALAAIAALLWKLRQQNRIAHSDWFNQSQLGGLPPAPPAPESVAPEMIDTVEAPTIDIRHRTPAPAPEAIEPALPELTLHDDDGDARGAPPIVDPAATRPLDRQAMAALMTADAAPRELSVEELLDLEQQADFFIALGQEDAAVDLLMSHLRSAGGQSPLPYTKLLEIYKRQGDRSAYERTRARFNRRFNAYAPDWDTGPSAGRSLEDYPDTVALLERAWASPIDAMAILEGLLFKRDDTSELFDLPAYRDVLVLYSLARDLWQHGGGSTGTQVDVLLPLDDSSQAGTASAPAYPSAREVNERALPLEDAGLDLESVDIEGDTRAAMLTSFEMTGYEPNHGGGHVDVDLSSGEGVHATLDGLSLAPVAPTKPRTPGWNEGDTPESEQPTKR